MEEQVGHVVVEGDVADLIELCGYPHRSTYADTATMPTSVLSMLVSDDDGAGFIGIIPALRGMPGRGLITRSGRASAARRQCCVSMAGSMRS